MATLGSSKQFTCRYWALGPSCPDVRPDGVVTCFYAHEDTGVLASPYEQRGTCKDWIEGDKCTKGEGCWYEHRDTGIYGLHQGPIKLTGFELEIAKSAYEAGFEEHNHEQLFQLIFTVKQIALQMHWKWKDENAIPNSPFEPEMCESDNWSFDTLGKQKANTTEPEPCQDNPDATHNFQAHAVFENSINLTSTDENDHHTREMTRIYKGKGKMKEITSSSANPEHATAQLGTSAPDVHPHYVRMTLSNENPRKAVINNNMINSAAVPKTVDSIIDHQLSSVHNKLENIIEDIHLCRAVMRSMFNMYSERFDNDDAMRYLRNLAESLEIVYVAAKNGEKDIEAAVDWLIDDKENCPALGQININ